MSREHENRRLLWKLLTIACAMFGFGFCFSQQTLAPGEARVMPVLFVIDPGMPAEVSMVTLSYTFFGLKQTAAAPAGRGNAG